jgi:hypothetical protein
MKIPLHKTNMSALEKRSGSVAIAYRERPGCAFMQRQEVRCVHRFFSNLFIEKDIFYLQLSSMPSTPSRLKKSLQVSLPEK